MLDETRVEKRENYETTNWRKTLEKKYFNERNRAVITGKLETEPEYVHKIKRGNFYKTRVKIRKKDGKEELIPILLPDVLIMPELTKGTLKDKWVELEGQFRSYHEEGEGGKRHLKIVLFVTMINIYDEEKKLNENKDENQVYFDGVICRTPFFKITHSGIPVTDFLINISRDNGEKSDYIPCVAWNKEALVISGFKLGDRIKFLGNAQSRLYFKRNFKKLDSGEMPKEGLAYSESVEYKETYEISVKKIIER